MWGRAGAATCCAARPRRRHGGVSNLKTAPSRRPPADRAWSAVEQGLPVGAVLAPAAAEFGEADGSGCLGLLRDSTPGLALNGPEERFFERGAARVPILVVVRSEEHTS